VAVANEIVEFLELARADGDVIAVPLVVGDPNATLKGAVEICSDAEEEVFGDVEGRRCCGASGDYRDEGEESRSFADWDTREGEAVGKGLYCI
jgi:hypothetical protein